MLRVRRPIVSLKELLEEGIGCVFRVPSGKDPVQILNELPSKKVRLEKVPSVEEVSKKWRKYEYLLSKNREKTKE